jgi:hypothetical protein
MKKVRYAIGMVGVLGAAPALGLLTPAANAAAGTHAPATGHTGKTVSLRPMTTPAATSALTTSTSTTWVPAASSAPAATSLPVPTLSSIAARTCTSTGGATAHSGAGVNKFTGHAVYHTANHCLAATSGLLSHEQTGLLLRTRAYNGRKEVYQHYVHGAIGSGNEVTLFTNTGIHKAATKACEALVYSTSRNTVAYGTVCEAVK